MKKLLFGGLAILLLSCSAKVVSKATYYHDKYDGRVTADGSKFSQGSMTGASNYYKLGDSVRVTNRQNGKTVDIKITDRMHSKYNKNRIDLSKKAFKKIGMLEQGIIEVDVKRL